MLYNLKIEGAEFFDRLSIIECKIFNCADFNKKEILKQQKEDLQENINNEISYDLAKKIYCSDFYTNLYNVNFELFDAVDKAKQDQVKASFVDNLVYKRHLAKSELQKEFFGEKTSEIKLGYGNTENQV